MSMFWALVFFGLSDSVLADVQSRGHCPQIDTMKDFDQTRFVGRWYKMKSYRTHDDIGFKCATMDFSLRENGTAFVGVFTLTMLRTGIRTSTPTLFRAPNPNNLGKLKSISTWNTAEVDWWVLDTDYVSYVIFYSCTENSSAHFEQATIETRELNPSQDVMAKINETIETRTPLNRAWFKMIPHDNCEVQPVSS